MVDKSIIQPVLAALDYFNKSSKEINYFYNVIDKFCASWFNKEVRIENFRNSEYLLIHDLLGEFIRFEENNKRVALWILAINRVCYNFNADLKSPMEDLLKLNNSQNEDIDSTLIEPILKELKIYEELHMNAGKNDRGEKDIISNFLQWVMAYTNFIYPTVVNTFNLYRNIENKIDFYNENTIRAMNFLLLEFIKLSSNVKRMAYLVMMIIEACRQYFLQNQNICSDFVGSCEDKDRVIAGTEEKLVMKILDKLKNENDKQKGLAAKEEIKEDFKADEYALNMLKEIIAYLNIDEENCISKFNKYISKITVKTLAFNEKDRHLFFTTLLNYPIKKEDMIKTKIQEMLKKATNLFSKNTKNRVNSELLNIQNRNDSYINDVIKRINMQESIAKINTSKLLIMVIFLQKLSIL